MGFGLFCDDFSFYQLFRKQWAVLDRAAVLLRAIMTDLQNLPTRCGEIHKLEAEQISLSREVIKELALTFIQPMEHQDVYALNRAFDEAMRTLKAVSTRMGLYGFAAPGAATKEIAGNLVFMMAEVGDMLEHLRTASAALLPVEKIDAIREETRMLFLVGVGELYEGRLDTPRDLLEIIKWTQIYDRLEEAFDRTSEVAGAVAAIILKNF